MIGGFMMGLVCGWLIAGGIVLITALRCDMPDHPLRLADLPVIIGGMLLWPLLLFPEDGDDA